MSYKNELYTVRHLQEQMTKQRKEKRREERENNRTCIIIVQNEKQKV